MAASVERIRSELEARGYPVATIDLVNGGASADVTYRSGTPQTVVAAAAAYLAATPPDGFDWSDQGERNWASARIRAAAKLLLTSNDPLVVVMRSLGLALMFTGQDTRRNDNVQIDRINENSAKLNEIIGRVNAALSLDPPIAAVGAPLEHVETGDTVQSALEQVAAVIDAAGVV